MSTPHTSPGLWKRRLALVAAALTALFAAFMAGRLQSRERIGRVQRESTELITGLQAQLASLSTRLKVADLERAQLEARRQMNLALLALDSRNFGQARTHLHQASEMLKASAPSPEAAALKRDIDNVDLTVSGDISQDRARIAALVARFDREIAASMVVGD